MKSKENERSVEKPEVINSRGSLGLLAVGYIGLKAWREKRKEAEEKETQKS